MPTTEPVRVTLEIKHYKTADARFTLHVPEKQQPDENGMVEYRCEITERKFALPAGAPVFCIECELREFSGAPLDPHEKARFIIHPSIAVEGPDSIRAALREAASWKRAEALEALTQALELEEMAAAEIAVQTWPAYWQPIPTEEPPHQWATPVRGMEHREFGVF